MGHESGLQANMMISHVAVNFRPWHEGCHRVNNYDIQAAASHKNFRDFQSLFTKIRLGNQQIFHIHSKAFCVGGIKGMFGINKGGIPSAALGFSNYMQGKGCFSR